MVLFHKMLLGFFIYEHLLGHCGLKIVVVKFVYLIFLKKPFHPLNQIILPRSLSS